MITVLQEAKREGSGRAMEEKGLSMIAETG